METIKNHLTGSDVFDDISFPLTILRRSPQIPFPKHTHDFTELVIIYGGSGIHFTDNEEYDVTAGDVFVLNGDRAHGYKNLENLQLVNIVFRKEILFFQGGSFMDLESISGFHALFTWEPRLRSEHHFQSRLHLKSAELYRATDFASKLETELAGREPGYQAMALSLFISLCGFLSRQYDCGSSPVMKELSRISGILNYMEKNTERSINTAELVLQAGMSESTLLRLFNRTTGFSPLEYHNRLRIEKVCDLLKSSGRTVTEIAYDAGFSDSNYMCRLFRKIKGVPPGIWRKRNSV